MKNKGTILIIVLTLSSLISKAQDEKFKALFIYNFTKYIEWPQEKRSGDFVIGVYGNNPIAKELEIIAQKKMVGSQKLIIKQVDGVSACMGCHILYIPENKSSIVETIMNSISQQGIVLITDKTGFAKSYSGINFVNINGKQQFEINKKHIENQGATVNSGLLSLGIIIE